jgi:hypothetical protein
MIRVSFCVIVFVYQAMYSAFFDIETFFFNFAPRCCRFCRFDKINAQLSSKAATAPLKPTSAAPFPSRGGAVGPSILKKDKMMM